LPPCNQQKSPARRISGTTHLRPPQAASEVDYVALQKQAADRRYRRRRDRLILRQRIR
jgi:hypothetical protein